MNERMLISGVVACSLGIVGISIWQRHEWNKIYKQLHPENNRPADRWTDVKVRDVK